MLTFARRRRELRLKNSVTQLLERKDLLALAALILITLAVRIPGVYSRAIWYDEAVTLLGRYADAFPPEYRSTFDARTAVAEKYRSERLIHDTDSLYRELLLVKGIGGIAAATPKYSTTST